MGARGALPVKRSRVVALLRSGEALTRSEIARRADCTRRYVTMIAAEIGSERERARPVARDEVGLLLGLVHAGYPKARVARWAGTSVLALERAARRQRCSA